MNQRRLLQAALLTVLGGALYSDGRVRQSITRAYRRLPLASTKAVVAASNVYHADGSGGLHAAPAHDTVGALNVTWDLAKLRDRLRSSGFELICPNGNTVGRQCVSVPISQPFMTVAGAVLAVNDAQLQAFFYADAEARARDTDVLDPKRVAPPTMMISWIIPPSLVVDNNLALIVLTRSEKVREKLKASLAARK